MEGQRRPRLAILVDGDQHLSSLRAIQEAAAAEGEISCAQVFADWDDHGRKPWEAFARRSQFEVVPVRGGAKNAADKEIARRVSELLENGAIDGFWIASSDRDFVSIARMIQDAGKSVRIVLAASRFPKELQSSLRIVDPFGPLPTDWAEEAALPIQAALSASPRHGGRVLLSDLVSRFKASNPSFSPMDFGSSTLIELIENLPEKFRVVRPPAGGAVFVEET